MCTIYFHCCCSVLHMWIFKHVLRENQYEKINKNRWTKKKKNDNAGLLLLSLSFSCISSIVSLSMRCSPHHKSYSIVVYCADNSYMSVTQFFLSPLFLYFFILKFRNLFLSVLSCVLFCSLLYISFPFFYYIILFYSFFCSLICSVFSFLFIQFIFWSPLLFSFQICYIYFLFSFPITLICLLLQICYPFFNIFSLFLIIILSASPLLYAILAIYYSICSLSVILQGPLTNIV